MRATDTETWFPYLQPNPRAGLRLFCFPYAGAGASVFRPWIAALGGRMEVCGAQYPGRETRSREKPCDSLARLVEDLARAILPLLDRPYVFFGHSMGALVSFELIRALTETYDTRPEHAFFSAAGAPHLPEPRPVCHLGDIELLRELVKLDGIPPQVLKSFAVIAYSLPILRADFTACETHRYRIGEPLQCPITVFGGDGDLRVDRQRLEAWRHHAGLSFSMKILRGGHFFLRSMVSELIAALVGEIDGVVDRMAVA